MALTGSERMALEGPVAYRTDDRSGAGSPGESKGTPALLRQERRFLLLLLGGIGAATGLAFLLLIEIASAYHGYAPLPGATTLAGSLTFFGAGILAYTFGLRHGVDADHIAAIDNTTRKLMHEGKRPLTVGTWFSLGHSTIVFLMSIGVVAAITAVSRVLPQIQQVGSVLGLVVSGSFLYLIGAINLVIAIEVYRVFRRLRSGELDEAKLEEQLQNRGFMNRYFGRMFRVVEKPRDIYPIGVLFGLGFDTASEIFLLATVAVLTVAGAPIYVVLVLPLLFTCGMVLVDTADGAAMRFAYGWAYARPVRKVFYNLTITIISVLVAFVIGTVEFLQVIATQLGLTGPFWSALASLDFETLGFLVIGTFLVSWGVATAYYRYARLDDLPFPRPPVGERAS